MIGEYMRYSIIPNKNEINEELMLAEKYNLGFEYNEFFRPDVLDDNNETKGLISFYKGLNRDRSMDTLHGVFLDIAIHSTDSAIRTASDKRIHQSMEAAASLGVKGVVFHTGLIPNYKSKNYIDNWLEKSIDYYNKLIEEYTGIEIYVENMFDVEYDFIRSLGLAMKENSHFGICLDYAHAAVFSGDAVTWYEELKPFIRHMHINDNDFNEDSHLALGDGSIDWDTFFNVTTDYKGSILIEVSGLDRQKRTLEYIDKNYR